MELACMLQAATEDGCVVLYNVTEDGVDYGRALSKLEGENITFVNRMYFYLFLRFDCMLLSMMPVSNTVSHRV